MKMKNDVANEEHWKTPYPYISPYCVTKAKLTFFLLFIFSSFQCGGCWAFSVVGGIESAYAIKGHNLEELSVQQVIDCSYSNYGCSGGSTITALSWLNQV